MLIVITGNGKGKTTSALGQALRVIGDGGKAIMYEFIKGPMKSGEDESVKRLYPEFQIIKGGLGFVGIKCDTHSKSEHIKKAEETWTESKKAIESRKYDLVVLDELNVALDLKLLKLAPVVSFLKKNKVRVNIMVTGRYADKKIIELGDIVSEIKDIKHPFHKGAGAKKGIEY
jgi:cob(I)alamin adenosyltransferase